MGGVLHFVAYIASGLAFGFLVLSLACGLYYLAELVEEYTVYTKKVIKSITTVVIVLHILFWIFDRLPFLLTAFSIICHLVYSLNLKNFPFISLTSVPFIGSCILVFADHFLWFNYFTKHYRPFMDIASFFGLCVWLVPFAYFISLSANDNALPTNSDPGFADTIPHQQKQGLLKTILNAVGIKTQDNTMPTSAPTSYSAPPSSSYTPPPPSSLGMASGIHYSPNRDIQSRKAL